MNAAVAVAVLLVIIVGSIGLVALVRPRIGKVDAGIAAGFATALYGLLLSLLLFAANTHFDTARHAASAEAAAGAALAHAATGLGDAERIRIQHDVICVMRATAASEWPTMAAGDDGSAAVRAARLRLSRTAAALVANGVPPETISNKLYHLDVDLGIARDARLAQSYEQISPALWVVVFLGAAVVVILTGMSVAEANRRRWVIAMLPMFILLAAVIYVLAAIDRPYSGAFFRVEPAAMRQEISDITTDFPDAGVRAPCP